MRYQELKEGDRFIVIREKGRQIYTKLKKGCTDGERVYRDYFPTTLVDFPKWAVGRKGRWWVLMTCQTEEEAKAYIKGKERYLEVRKVL